MRVHYSEGLATRTGPEPCADVREDVGEASAGDRTGQPLSRERKSYPGRRRSFVCGRQYGGARYASALSARRGQRTWHVRTLLAREPGDLWLDHSQRQQGGPHREGEEP